MTLFGELLREPALSLGLVPQFMSCTVACSARRRNATMGQSPKMCKPTGPYVQIQAIFVFLISGYLLHLLIQKPRLSGGRSPMLR